MTRILCVAEKPSIAKAVAGHLSGGHYQTVGIPFKVPKQILANCKSLALKHIKS